VKYILISCIKLVFLFITFIYIFNINSLLLFDKTSFAECWLRKKVTAGRHICEYILSTVIPTPVQHNCMSFVEHYGVS